MISSGCGESAAGRESSEPRPLQTDARPRAEVGGAQIAAERGGPGRGCGAGLRRCGAGRPCRGARRWRKVSCAFRAPRAGCSAGPGRCGARAAAAPSRCDGDAAWQRGGGGAPGGSRHCSDRPRAPGGPALAAAAGLRHLGRRPHPLPAPERAECGARRAPRPSRAPRARVFPCSVCILRMCFPFSYASGNLAAARGFLGKTAALQ